MIIVEGWVRMEPGELERLHDAAVAMITETRKEAGCISYSYGRSMEEPDVMRIAVGQQHAALERLCRDGREARRAQAAGARSDCRRRRSHGRGVRNLSGRHGRNSQRAAAAQCRGDVRRGRHRTRRSGGTDDADGRQFPLLRCAGRHVLHDRPGARRRQRPDGASRHVHPDADARRTGRRHR
ncbi:hypothetical protein HFP57_08995 [Parasphingopyxis algicola]|nr:hypothetical protein HFP57_08995 [Parasphingopyxis algicola]